MPDTIKIHGVYIFVGWDQKLDKRRGIVVKIYYKDISNINETYSIDIVQYGDFTRDIKPGAKFKFDKLGEDNDQPIWYYMSRPTAMEIFLCRRSIAS